MRSLNIVDLDRIRHPRLLCHRAFTRFYTQFWLLAIGNAVAMLLYAGVPLLHRLGVPVSRPIVVSVLFFADMLAYIFGCSALASFWRWLCWPA